MEEGQLQNQEAEMSADELIAGLDGQEQQQVEHPEGFDPESFNSHLKRLAGIDSIDEIKKLAQLRDKVPTLEQQLNEYKVKANTNPFANDLAKNFNEMLGQGKNLKEVMPYLQLQMTDLESIDPSEAIKMRQKFEMPNWSEQKLNDWFKMTYPDIDEEADDAEQQKIAREIKIDLASKEAREVLSKQKADMTLPENGGQIRQQQMAQRAEQIKPLATALMDRFTEIPIREEFEDGSAYEFNYKVGLSPDEKQSIVNSAIQYHAGRGTPMTQAGLAQIQETIKKLTLAMTAEDRIKSVIRDARASSVEQEVLRVTNTKPVSKGSGSKPVVRKEGRQPIIERNGVTYA